MCGGSLCHGKSGNGYRRSWRYYYEYPQRYGYPKQGYFDWQIKNGEYYVLILEEELWKNERHVLLCQERIMDRCLNGHH